jgi:hypothetical protein
MEPRRAAPLLAGLALALGGVVAMGMAAVWFLRSSDAHWLGGFAAVLAALPTTLLAVAAIAGARRHAGQRRALAAGSLALLLGIAGLAFAAGVLPQRNVLPREVTFHLHNAEPAEHVVALALTDGHGRAAFEHTLRLGANGSAAVRSPPLPPSPYQLTVTLGDGRTASERVVAGWPHLEVVVLLERGSIRVEQAHGD